VALVRTDVSEEPSASFIRVTRMGEPGTTPAATSNQQHSVTSQKTPFFRKKKTVVSLNRIKHWYLHFYVRQGLTFSVAVISKSKYLSVNATQVMSEPSVCSCMILEQTTPQKLARKMFKIKHHVLSVPHVSHHVVPPGVTGNSTQLPLFPFRTSLSVS
jgi:hypothetical protein